MRLTRSGFVLVEVLVTAAAAVDGYRVGARLGSPDRDGSTAWLPGTGTATRAWLEIPTPDVEFQTAAGGTARLSDFEGQIVLLNFWGSWCPPCLIEIPHLVEVQKVLEDLGGTIVGPAVDSGSGADVLKFAEEKGINYPVWMSNYETAVGKFGAAGYPFTLLIDRAGVIRRTYLGPQTSTTLLRDIAALVVDERATADSSGTAQRTGAALSSSS